MASSVRVCGSKTAVRRLRMIIVGDCYIAVLEVPRKSNIRVSNSHCYV